MNLKHTIDKFLDTISESSSEIYKTKIYIFHKFLVCEKGINDKSYQSYLEAMKIEEVEESLDFYIISNEIKSESIAWHYISVVKRYFNFIYKLGIQNINLIKSFGLLEDHSDSFQRKMREKIFNDTRLEKREPKSELIWEEVEVLISECDQQIKEIVEENKVLDYNKSPIKYNDLMSSIIIKLILFTGVPYRVVRDIRYDSINTVHNTIGINEYYIHLPNNLSEQLSYYINARNKVLDSEDIKSDNLFINADGSKLGVKTSIVADTLKAYMGRSDVTGIIKFAVIEMIKRGVNQSVIQDFTKVGGKIYSYCQQKVNENKNLSASRYLDSKLRNLEIFDLM